MRSFMSPVSVNCCGHCDAGQLCRICFCLGSFENRLGINGYFYGVADDEAAFVHLVVPTYPEVVPIDGGLGDEASACLGSFVNPVFPPGRLPLPEVVNLQRNRPHHSANRKLTGHLVIYLAYDNYLIAAETDLGKILYVQKVRAAEVRVTCWLAGPELARIDN